jgi:hypothetical protein
MKNKPIRVTPTSDDQRFRIAAYAEVKGFQGPSAFMLFATENYMSRNALSEAQKARVEDLRKNDGRPTAALAREGFQGNSRGGQGDGE